MDGEMNIDMEEDMDLTEDDFRNVSGQFLGEASKMEVKDDVNMSVETVKVDVSLASKHKLESLLQQWSEWEAKQNSLSEDHDQKQVLESGDETYFPALRVGLQKTSSVSFWFDYQTGLNSLKKFGLLPEIIWLKALP